MKKLLSGFVFVVATCILHAQIAPSIEWQKSLGGNLDDKANSIQQTGDGGFIIAGTSNSNEGDVSGHHGGPGYTDFWVVKLDSAGNLIWQKSLGGSENDAAYSVQQIHDGGFIVAGTTLSNDGDVSGNHGIGDFWIVKLDSAGNLIWQKCLGGSGGDWGNSLQEITGGGFIVSGYSDSNDGDVTGNHGDLDYWVVKLDADANILWQKSLGGSGTDYPRFVEQTLDGGFVVAGYTNSIDGDISVSNGGYEYWIVKLDSDGDLEWQNCLGGSLSEDAYSIQQTSDGEFIVGGYSRTYLNDGDVTGNHGQEDYWIVKLEATGNLLWQKSLGGSFEERAFCIQQVTQGFVVAGYSESINEDVTGNHGNYDFWIVKLDDTGNLVWQQCYGGSNYEAGNFIQQTTDGGFIVAGESTSNDYDVSGHHGNLQRSDFWIVKLSAELATGIASPSNHFISLFPNPVQTQLNITLAVPANDVTIRIYDLQGRIQEGGFRINDFGLSNSLQLSTGSLTAGFYTLQIINNKTGEGTIRKFVKQ